MRNRCGEDGLSHHCHYSKARERCSRLHRAIESKCSQRMSNWEMDWEQMEGSGGEADVAAAVAHVHHMVNTIQFNSYIAHTCSSPCTKCNSFPQKSNITRQTTRIWNNVMLNITCIYKFPSLWLYILVHTYSYMICFMLYNELCMRQWICGWIGVCAADNWQCNNQIQWNRKRINGKPQPQKITNKHSSNKNAHV